MSTKVMEGLQMQTNSIRNFCMLAHVDHGKTTLSDFLIASNGLLSTALAGTVRFMDSRPDEQIRLITMKASSIALVHENEVGPHLLHLVDSPGHIDFSCEVSTAIRLCDGAAVVVDVVDGVTPQTMHLLREAYMNSFSMVLVLNKMDLLITRLQLTPGEAYDRLRTIVESCNAALAAFRNHLDITGGYDHLTKHDPEDEVWFSPTKGNVVFVSCYDKWGFSVESVIDKYAEKFGIAKEALRDGLWGPHYLDAKGKQIVNKPLKSGQETAFVQLLLGPVWAMYQAFEESDIEKAQMMSSRLGIPEKAWNLSGKDDSTKLQLLIQRWLPLAPVVLDALCKYVLSPVESQQRRVPYLLPPAGSDEDVPADLRTSLENCNAKHEASVSFVSKLVDTQSLAGSLNIADEREFAELFVCFARVYCGTLRIGDKVFANSAGKQVERTITRLYRFRGRGLEDVQQVSAGCLCGIGDIAPDIVKYGTVSTVEMPALQPMSLMSSSILTVSVIPQHPSDLARLTKGLQLLNQVDSQVQIGVLPTGERVLCCAGEVHLERCVKDLKETFACVDLKVSEPIVSFRETIVVEEGKKVEPQTASLPGLSVSFTLRRVPDDIWTMINDDHANNASPEFMNACREKLEKCCPEVGKVVDVGPMKHSICGAFLCLPESVEVSRTTLDAIRSGFQLATMNGPMAEEPLFGIAVVLGDIESDEEASATPGFSGLAMLSVKEAIRNAVEAHPRRLVEPILHCTILSAGATQGKIYALLNRRRADVLEEIPNEGNDTFTITSHLPAGEALGLQDEIRIATHGAGSAQLRMSHWAMVDADPYFQPTTRDEVEDFGQDVLQNLGMRLLEQIRKRKGIHRENIVEDAEKQKFSIRGA